MLKMQEGIIIDEYKPEKYFFLETENKKRDLGGNRTPASLPAIRHSTNYAKPEVVIQHFGKVVYPW